MKNDKFIYCDNINTTFPAPEVIAALNDVLGGSYGNPSSHVHSAGIRAGLIMDRARQDIADFISCSANSIIFTSGATESNNLALSGFLKVNSGRKLVISSIEHFSLLNQASRLRANGVTVDIIDVDNTGLIDLDALEKSVESSPALVSISPANPEIGTIQDIEKISKICAEHNALLHCDCTSAAGLMEIDLARLKIDLLTLSGHNLYGPMGIGALYVADHIAIGSLFQGGNQENGIRPGTENLPGIAGMAAACKIAKNDLPALQTRLSRMGERLRTGLEKSIPFIHFTGHQRQRLPGHVSFWVEHIEGESMLLLLSMKGVMASSGSACSSNLRARDESGLTASHVLSAVGVPSDICAGSLTFSLGRYNNDEDIDYLLSVLPDVVEKLLAMSPSYADFKKGSGNKDE